MPLTDYYSILEVSPSATLEQIKHSYRRLVRLYHPDLNGETEDRRIKQLNEAYTVLSDLSRRAAYDSLRLEEMRLALLQEALQRQRAERERKMTWKEGLAGFMKELKKGMRDD